MVDLIYYLINLILFDIPLLQYISFRSSITLCLSSGYIYIFISLDIYLPSFFLTIFKLLCLLIFFQTFEILMTIFLPIKSLAPSAVF